ncbi:MAG: hypothetical protein GTO42_01155 [Candidatus Latescibacteria bacterium]|nr:hypothetical protein [Candidatus Latescibacterota bacterium]NIO27137.1 hypothetical protein [Candidatus Latescibacterota bacterium]NIO54661.1 hypothetical protein [Candidatus Latescibacterota bacterium]NIT00744.1 hypothetical protein [Candidatus Latescibacterota bacterium]NIT37667.1 hypothetical protein [Candidatus Latescibacterota bacterium]
MSKWRDEKPFIEEAIMPLIGPWAILIIVLVAFTSSCGSEKDLQDLDGETGFRFGIWDDTTGVEDFVAVTADKGIISSARAQLLLPASQRSLHIHGVIGLGSGGHNLAWGWHFLPGQWSLTEESTEICDGRPSAIEASIDDWPDTLTLFCPLSSYVKAEIR